MRLNIEGSPSEITILVDGVEVYTKGKPAPLSPNAPVPTSLAWSSSQQTAEPLPFGLAKAGDSYRNSYGFVMEKLTDEPSGSQHFYTSPHPVNCDGTLLVYSASQGGGMFLQDLVGKTTVRQIITGSRTPTSYAWHPTDPKLLYVTIGQGLYAYWTDQGRFLGVADFDMPETTAGIFLGMTDGQRFAFDYRFQSKVSHGYVLYDMDKGIKRQTYCLTLNNAPTGMNLVGMSATKDMETILAQVNGSYPSTLTFKCAWDEDPLKAARLMLPATPDAPLGVVTGHGAVSASAHHRITTGAAGDGVGYLSGPNGPKWLASVRSHNFAKDEADVDRYTWVPSPGWGGMHLSANEETLLLSTYKESPSLVNELPPVCEGELILIGADGQAVISPKWPSPSTVTNPPVVRIGRHFCRGLVPYWSQPRASISLDGKEAVFTSDMDGTLQVYRIWLK